MPLPEGALGGQDEETVHLLLVDAGLEQYSGLNRFSQTHLVGNEKPVWAWPCCSLDPEVLLVRPELSGHRLGGSGGIVGDGIPDAAP